jgi:RimJ/RimL family protein N-acetyltransferase
MNDASARGLRTVLAGARWLGFGYECYRVLRRSLARDERASPPSLPEGFRFAEVSAADVLGSNDTLIRDCDWYGGPGALGFAIRDAREDIAALQWYWFGERYHRAAFWEISASEAASVHLVTLPAHRNQGLATELKRASARAMAQRGFTALYSRIWWTNAASLRVSEKLGWQRVGSTLRILLPLRAAPLSFRWRARSAGGSAT